MGLHRAGFMNRGRVLLVAAVLLAAVWVAGQQPAPADLPATVLRVTTRMVLVDVVVTDKDGRAVSDLSREDFQLFEDGKAQRITAFSFQRPDQPPPVEPPPLPPDVYTNRPEYHLPPGPLTILLLDGLNTPLTDQAYARDQMLRYLKTQLKPGQRTAIFALGNSLYLLQDFTTDPSLLQAALEKLQGQQSVALKREEPGLAIPEEGAALLAVLAQHPGQPATL